MHVQSIKLTPEQLAMVEQAGRGETTAGDLLSYYCGCALRVVRRLWAPEPRPEAILWHNLDRFREVQDRVFQIAFLEGNHGVALVNRQARRAVRPLSCIKLRDYPSIGTLANLVDLIAGYTREMRDGTPHVLAGRCRRLRGELASGVADLTGYSGYFSEEGGARVLRVVLQALRQLEPDLQSLLLGHCRMRELPEEIGSFASLRCLSLEDNRLVRLPAAIGNLSALEELFLGSNLLRELPREVGDLTALRVLDCVSFRQRYAPGGGGGWMALPVFANGDLLYGVYFESDAVAHGGNRGIRLPREIGRLAHLVTLKVSGDCNLCEIGGGEDALSPVVRETVVAIDWCRKMDTAVLSLVGPALVALMVYAVIKFMAVISDGRE